MQDFTNFFNPDMKQVEAMAKAFYPLVLAANSQKEKPRFTATAKGIKKNY